MLNVQRKSAPLPERSFERITCSTTLIVAYAGNCSAIDAQSEGADRRRRSIRGTQNILLKNAVGHAVRKAKNSAGGATDAIFSGYQVVINSVCYQAPACGDDFLLRRPILVCTLVFRNCSMWKFLTFSCSISCEISCAIFLAKKSFNLGMVRPLLAVRRSSSLGSGASGDYSGCSLALRRWSSSRATVTSCPISSAALTPIFSTCASASSEETKGFSPLPSAWRRAISPRMAVTINPALLSPSSFTDSIPSITSWGIRIEICFDLSLIVFLAMCILLNNKCDSVYTKKNHKKHLTCDLVEFNLNHTSCEGIQTTKPRTVGAVTGLLTKPLVEVTIMAGTQHTQTHPKFIYTFLAVHRDCMDDGKTTVHVAADTLVDACEMLNDMGYASATWQGREENTLFIQKCENNFVWRFIALSTAQPRVITIEATSEQEARQQSPAGCVMVFAARIRKEVRHA